MKFLDEAKIFARSGSGGPGSLSFRREKFIEYGGPDGGDGGKGGDVVAVAVAGLNTLIDFRYQPHVRAANGRGGAGRNRTGANGADAVIQMPVGTEILFADEDVPIADLTEPGQRAVLLPGGRGGKGNLHYKTSINRAPRRVQPGEPAQERIFRLRLKLIADVGLIGLPNAGKSTLLAAASRARPRIADYPFTTLHPQLGVVYVDGAEFVLADLPGLIEGAHEGAGLGHRFLQHVERCRAMLHLVDGTATDPAADYRIIVAELKAYGHGLADRPRLVALNKCDALTKAEATLKQRKLARSAKQPVLLLSGQAGTGLPEVLRALRRLLEAGALGDAA